MRQFTNLSERSHYCQAPDFGLMTGTLATDNAFSTSIQMSPGIGMVATRGTWAGSITVQISDNNSTWYDVEIFTTNFAKTLNIGFKSYVRVGFNGSSHTSGTATYVLGQGY